MSVLIWLLIVLFGLSTFAGGEDAAVEGSEGIPIPGSTDAPSNADPFPDGLGVPSTKQEIEERFATRSPLPACGFIDVASEAGSSEVDRAWRCLQGAVDGDEGAELVVYDFRNAESMSTTYYRVNPDGPLEVFVDTSELAGTVPDWEYRQCEPSDDLASGPCTQ